MYFSSTGLKAICRALSNVLKWTCIIFLSSGLGELKHTGARRFAMVTLWTRGDPARWGQRFNSHTPTWLTCRAPRGILCSSGISYCCAPCQPMPTSNKSKEEAEPLKRSSLWDFSWDTVGDIYIRSPFCPVLKITRKGRAPLCAL